MSAAWWRRWFGGASPVACDGGPARGGPAPATGTNGTPAGVAADQAREGGVGDRCPECGDPVQRQASAAICESCGWRRFSTSSEAPSELRCSWCQTVANPGGDGFHLVHVAFGTFQERHCFCSDACYEAFRKMYPSRVHRNCYERDCRECDLCVKRYEDGVEGWRGLTRVHAGSEKERVG